MDDWDAYDGWAGDEPEAELGALEEQEPSWGDFERESFLGLLDEFDVPDDVRAELEDPAFWDALDDLEHDWHVGADIDDPYAEA